MPSLHVLRISCDAPRAHIFNSSSNLTVMEIVGRIEANQELFQRKYAKKIAAEDEYYNKRYKLKPKDGTSASS